MQERAPAEAAGTAAGEDGMAAEEEEEEDEEYEIPDVREGPLEARPWTDLGSEEEMKKHQVAPGRPPVVIEYFRRCSDAAMHPLTVVVVQSKRVRSSLQVQRAWR